MADSKIRFTAERLATDIDGRDSTWMVRVGQDIVGRVDKSRNTRTKVQPWRVFQCIETGLDGFRKFRLIAHVYSATVCRGKKKPKDTDIPAIIGGRSDAMRLAAIGV